MFGASVAAAYGLLMASHIVFGLFFGLTVVCSIRGLYLYASARAASRHRVQSEAAAQPSAPAPHMVAPAGRAAPEPVMSGRAD